jgi:hypothetical protein
MKHKIYVNFVGVQNYDAFIINLLTILESSYDKYLHEIKEE